MSVRDYSVDALVIHEKPLGDHDKILTLLTSEQGKVNVIAKGAKSLKNRYMPACRAFVWGNFEIHERSADSRWLRDASVNESFGGLSEDIAMMYLATYIADVCMELSGQNEPAEDMLRLALNTYYALSRKLKPVPQIKAVFEWKAAELSGYMPDLSCCRICGKTVSDMFYLDVMNGGLVCPGCAASEIPAQEYPGAVPVDEYGTRLILLPLRGQVAAALRYVLEVPMKNMLGFELRNPSDLSDFAKICETYLLSHLETGFSSLKYYRELTK